MPTSPRGEQTRFSHLHTDYFFHIAEAETEPKVEPHGMADDLWGKRWFLYGVVSGSVSMPQL
jgi:hypothetical protein